MALGRNYSELSFASRFNCGESRERERERERESFCPPFSFHNERGTPLGNLTSQLFSNIYLNPLDQFVKRELKEKYYLRYADDFVVLSCDKSHLEDLIVKLRSYLIDILDLELHPDKIILCKWSQGIDFLGYVTFPYYTVLRTKTKKRMLRKIRQNCRLLNRNEMSREKFDQVMQSYFGILSHCRSHGLLNEVNRMVNEAGIKKE